MNALRITETATHRRTAPTRLEALPVPVLMDIPATGIPARVTNERFFYILFFRKFQPPIRTLATTCYLPRVSITEHRKYL